MTAARVYDKQNIILSVDVKVNIIIIAIFIVVFLVVNGPLIGFWTNRSIECLDLLIYFAFRLSWILELCSILHTILSTLFCNTEASYFFSNVRDDPLADLGK